MLAMPRSKNRRKKPSRPKKAAKSNKHVNRSTPAHQQAVPTDEPMAMQSSDYEKDDSGSGTMIGMRRLISGAQPAKDGFFSRRRTLGEWALWFGGLYGVYYAISHFLAK